MLSLSHIDFSTFGLADTTEILGAVVRVELCPLFVTSQHHAVHRDFCINIENV